MSRYSIIFLLFSLNLAKGESLNVWDFLGTGVKDNENIRFASLAPNSPPKGSIQTEFSICASLLLRAYTEEQSIFQVLDDRNLPWFVLDISYFDLETSVATIGAGVNDQNIRSIYLKVQPHGWIHTCFSTDTRTGDTRITFNDQIYLHEDMNTQFQDSTSRIPADWTGKVVIGKWHYQDRWLQSLGAVTNINIFKRALPESEMLKITNSENCVLDGDYLSWSQMDWDVTGDVEMYDTNYAELCGNNFKSYKFILTHLQSWYECRDNCRIYRGSHMASFPDAESNEFNTNWIMKRMFEKTTDEDNVTTLSPFQGGCYR